MATSCTSPSVSSLWEINKHTVHLPSLLQVNKHRCSWTHQLSFYMQSSAHELTKLWTLLSHFNCFVSFSGTRRFKQCTLKLYNYSWPVYLFIIYFLVWVFKKIAHEFNVPRKPRVKPSHRHMKEERAHVTTTCLTPRCSAGDTDTWQGLGGRSRTSSPWRGTANQLPVCPSISCVAALPKVLQPPWQNEQKSGIEDIQSQCYSINALHPLTCTHTHGSNTVSHTASVMGPNEELLCLNCESQT